VKGPGPSIKEDTWKVVKVSGKGPERFRFQEDWAIDLSEGEIWHFGNRGFER
jgi:hypothetical protein